MLWIWPALTLCALALLLLAESRQSHAGKWLFKPVASLGFILTALACGALDSVYGIIILVGLVLSLVGDVLLIPRRHLAFLAGLVAFLLGHVAYVVAFVVHGFMPLAAILAGLALVGFGLVLARRDLRRIDAGMHGPVLAYGIVITAMLALAVGATAAGGSWLIVTGAALFYLSDLSVARDRLIETSFLQRAWGLPAYFIGQLMLAASVMA
jgi:uncharacterized membrane protein YhhN